MAEKKTEVKKEVKKEYPEAKRLAGLLQDYFNGHYKIDLPDLQDIQNFLNSLT
jgi:hypothetical protein